MTKNKDFLDYVKRELEEEEELKRLRLELKGAPKNQFFALSHQTQ